jgi:hypothetical protein
MTYEITPNFARKALAHMTQVDLAESEARDQCSGITSAYTGQTSVTPACPVHDAMRQAFDSWFPYEGSPDLWTVWQAAWQAAWREAQIAAR